MIPVCVIRSRWLILSLLDGQPERDEDLAVVADDRKRRRAPVRLTSFSDYALRILIYAAAHPDSRVTIEAASDYFGISRAHLKKVVLKLSHEGFLISTRGRFGGFALARPPEEINLGAVVRVTEPDFGLFECFVTGNQCRISRSCALPSIANEALCAFLAVFDRHQLSDVKLKADLLETQTIPMVQPIRGPFLSKKTSSSEKRHRLDNRPA